MDVNGDCREIDREKERDREGEIGNWRKELGKCRILCYYIILVGGGVKRK